MSKVLRPQAGTGSVYHRPSAGQNAAFLTACCSVAAAFGLFLVSLTGMGTGGGSSAVSLHVVLTEQALVATKSEPVTTIVETEAETTAGSEVVVAVQDASDEGESAAVADLDAAEATAGAASAGSGASGGVTAITDSPLAGRTVWSNGDSTSYFMSLWLLGSMKELGAIPVHEAEYWQSSGLSTPEFFDWPAYLREQMTQYDPEIVVFMVGTNDLDPAMKLDEYRAIVAEQMDFLVDREVYWIGIPSFDAAQRPDLANMAPVVNELFASEAAKRPWVTYVDVMAATTDENGNYARSLPSVTGEVAELRAVDGIHFTSAGGRVMAAQILAAIQSR